VSANRSLFALATLASTVLATLVTSDALAYCRLRTCLDGEDGSECRRNSRGCIAEGEQLSYASPCLSFAVAQGDGWKLGLSDRELADAISVAFERWRAVDCGDGSYPGFFVQNMGLVEAERAYVCEDPERNASVWLVYDTWRLDADALANTSAVFDQDTGNVVDADVELNLQQVLAKTPAGKEWDALLAVATHEAGHVLGLDHSEVEGSLMSAEYADGELVGRELTRDDVDGICDLYPPDDSLTECRRARVPEGALDDESCTGAILDELYDTDGSDGPAKDEEDSGCALAPLPSHAGWNASAAALSAPFAVGLALGGRRRRQSRGGGGGRRQAAFELRRQ
jgi:hypothetical protein